MELDYQKWAKHLEVFTKRKKSWLSELWDLSMIGIVAICCWELLIPLIMADGLGSLKTIIGLIITLFLSICWPFKFADFSENLYVAYFLKKEKTRHIPKKILKNIKWSFWTCLSENCYVFHCKEEELFYVILREGDFYNKLTVDKYEFLDMMKKEGISNFNLFEIDGRTVFSPT